MALNSWSFCCGSRSEVENLVGFQPRQEVRCVICRSPSNGYGPAAAAEKSDAVDDEVVDGSASVRAKSCDRYWVISAWNGPWPWNASIRLSLLLLLLLLPLPLPMLLMLLLPILLPMLLLLLPMLLLSTLPLFGEPDCCCGGNLATTGLGLQYLDIGSAKTLDLSLVGDPSKFRVGALWRRADSHAANAAPEKLLPPRASRNHRASLDGLPGRGRATRFLERQGDDDAVPQRQQSPVDLDPLQSRSPSAPVLLSPSLPAKATTLNRRVVARRGAGAVALGGSAARADTKLGMRPPARPSSSTRGGGLVRSDGASQ
jgi:hypothetical protein